MEEICRKRGVSEATFYRWKKKYAGMGIAGVRRLRQLGEENTFPKDPASGARLKKPVADLSPDKTMLQDASSRTGGPR